MSKRLHATAIVEVRLAIRVPDSWGSECTLEQVQKQASESAINVLRSALVVDHLSTPSGRNGPRVSTRGEPKVECIAVVVASGNNARRTRKMRTLTLSDAVWDRLGTIAKARGTSRSQVVEDIVKERK
jgi:hypothetical protein